MMLSFKISLLNLVLILNFLASCLEQVACQNDLDCRCVLPVSSRIVGGRQVDGYVPWLISLAYYEDHICGGTLVSRYYIITAAHCTKNLEISKLTVRVGINRLDDPDIASKTYTVENVHVYPDYINISYPGDIAILKLETPVEFVRNKVEPGCLGLERKEYPNGFQTAGFGAFQSSYINIDHKLVVFKNSNFLKKVDLAETFDKSEDHLINVDQIRLGDSICNGDSGSGLNYFEPNGKMSVVGLASFVKGSRDHKIIKFCYGPSSFARLSYYKDFIKDIVETVCEL